jgi:hypothetical protein
LDEQDFPARCQTAERASAAAQKGHFRLLIGHLGVLVAVALLAVVSAYGDGSLQTTLGVATALLMVLAIGMGIVQRYIGLDARWFACRAIAENVKSLTWRYVMGAFGAGAGPDEVDAEFLEALRTIQARFPAATPGLAQSLVVGVPEVSDGMRRLRAADLQERTRTYAEGRIADQVGWYGRKAKWNRARERIWGALVFVLEGAAVAFLVVRIWQPHWLEITGVLATAASAVIAWTQARRYADLSSTYLVACQDLNDLALRVPHVASEADLAALVDDVEGAVSREHGMWLSRSGAEGTQL